MVKVIVIGQALNLKKRLLNTYVLVTGDIVVAGGDTTKNCPSFTKCVTHINDDHIDTTENIDIKTSDNFSDTPGI